MEHDPTGLEAARQNVLTLIDIEHQNTLPGNIAHRRADNIGAALYMKHAFITDATHGGNLALMGRMSMHQQDADYGLRTYNVNEKNANAQLMYETGIGSDHNLSAGLSLNYDYLHQDYNLGDAPARLIVSETTPGGYAQYTFNHHNRLIAMAGLRVDHSNVYGTFLTPRFHQMASQQRSHPSAERRQGLPLAPPSCRKQLPVGKRSADSRGRASAGKTMQRSSDGFRSVRFIPFLLTFIHPRLH